MRLLCLLVLWGVVLSAHAQQFTPTELDSANTARNAPYLGPEEKKVLLYVNLARLNGPVFVKQHLLPHLEEGHDDPANPYVQSLIKTLAAQKPLPALRPSHKMTDAARYHAEDMGHTGKTGHNSSNGDEFALRIRRFTQGSYLAENCSYGYDRALRIVIQLLIDSGIESLGHRQNLLHPQFKYMGVAIRAHKTYTWNCVQDFADAE